ncbi:MAG TPA: hypothetical protein VKA95_12980 [Nitrososphaeraceae archaeon]|jgi:hypothetical protein|nr:hypothetical protein [Nitrososphaeraceae archaeon]
MKEAQSNSYNVYTHIIVNSLFTKKQIDIISKRLNNAERPKNMTSGAYYRQIKQCREKVRRLLYSLLLLRSLALIDNQTFLAIERISEQLSVIFGNKSSDISQVFQNRSVIFTIDELIKRMNTL